jgi:hypothetical protein
VEIHLLGWPPELVQSSASVDVAPMRAMRTDHAELREVVRGVSTGGVEVALADPTAARVFRVELSAGPYRVLVQSELVGYAETEVVVRDTDGVQVLELRPE